MRWKNAIVAGVASLTCVALASTTATADDKKPADKERITYQDHVLPIFRQRCGSCHNPNDRKGGLALDSYAAAMEGGSSGTVVEGGDPDASYLWMLVTHDSEPFMPPGADKLPQKELDLIRTWIEQGLLENSGSKAKITKSTVSKIEVTTDRPAEVAMPTRYFGDPQYVSDQLNAVTALAVSPWASLAAVSGHQQVSLYDTAKLEHLGTLPFPEGQPHIIKFSRNGSLLLVGGGRGGASGKVIVFDVKTGERMIEVGDEYDQVLAADISSDHSLIALGGPKRIVRVYSASTGEMLYEIKKHTDWVTAIEFSPDGVLLATGGRSNGLFVWEAFTGRPFHDLKGHTGQITDVSWRTDSNVLASSSSDGNIKLWEMNNGSQIKSWGAHGGGAEAVEYVRDGRIVSTGRDRVARLWKGDGGKIRDFGGLKDLGLEVAFDAESERLLGGDWTGEVCVWNGADGAELGRLSTNPPTLAARMTSAQQELAKVEAEAQKQVAALEAMKKARQAEEAAAQQAAKQAEMASAKVAEVTAKKAEADELAAERNASLAKAGEALKQAEAALAAAKKAYEEAAKGQQAAQVASTEAAKQATTLAQQAQEAAKQAEAQKAAAAKAAEEAKPTAEEQKALAEAEAAAKAAQERAAQVRARLEELKTLQENDTRAASVTP
ncbi:WD domain, G-beta repeat [Maioricimonas rarisocia]|uniref:WD domain, G-beta repeat n=1 Tax=Maioricimonas rarisocia TaxID=2528026 RepID=A0A517ZCZ3_9PLAN|nr:c-type cytochrome domain-containing protein [Maioricimonas rarisocia]QDU40310.1 WD domain, G-beta repeat [Maioricimonas rarisocia]